MFLSSTGIFPFPRAHSREHSKMQCKYPWQPVRPEMGLISGISFSRPSARVWISHSFPPLKGAIRDCEAAPAVQIPSKDFTPEWLGCHQKWPTVADWNVNWRQGPKLMACLALRSARHSEKQSCRPISLPSGIKLMTRDHQTHVRPCTSCRTHGLSLQWLARTTFPIAFSTSERAKRAP